MMNPTLGPRDVSALLITEDIYQKMIEEVEDYAIILLDTAGNIHKWNKGASRIKGYAPHEIIGKNFRLFYSEADRKNGLPDRLLEQARQAGKAQHEGWRLRKDGTRFWGSIVITALHDGPGEVIGFTKVTRDLTERMQAQQREQAYIQELELINRSLTSAQKELQRKVEELYQSNLSLEQFVSVVSHDLRAPLRKASTFFSMLMQYTGSTPDPRAVELKRKVYRSLERGEQLIEDLLALSIIKNPPKFSPVALTDLLDDVIEALEVPILEKKAIIRVGELPRIMGVASYLVQLFSNLIGNALKFTTHTPVIGVAATLQERFAVISVSDNGIGMEAAYFDKIFQVFQRLHPAEYEGAGIGLAICKKIAEVHGGKIEVESTVGEGTTFYVWLPVVLEEALERQG